MKFSEGFWSLRKGVSLYSPVEARDITAFGRKLKVVAPTKNINHRGDTLNLAQITIEFSSPLPDIIGVRIMHHRGRVARGSEFKLNSDTSFPIDLSITDDYASLTSGSLAVKISRKNWQVDFEYAGRRITGTKGKSMGYLTTENDGAFVREQLNLDVGEYVYGLGERFTPFVKNGQSVDIWNEDGGTSSELSYKNIPFYITSKGYGVLVNHPERVSYEIASEVVSKVQFSVPGESLEYFVVGGSSLKDVLKNYTCLTGKPSLPPAWSFGLWLSTSFLPSYDENTVNSFIDGMKKTDIPLSVFHFDCFWMKEFQWCDFQWDRDVFPDPAAILKRLKDKGLKICVWINPYIAQKSCLFDEGMENGYLLKTKDGDVWQCDLWQAGMGIVDFTNPAAVTWYQEKLKALLDMGVDCFKTDFGERIPTDVVYYDGSNPGKMHNYYTQLYNKAVFELLQRERKPSDAVVFARSATVGGQQFPVHWGGDCTANYPSMAESLRGGLSLCLSGFGFWSHDIGGFEQTATPDLYKRWVAFGLLSTHSRLHGSTSYRVPWLFDEEAVDVLRFFTKLKCRLMPYLYHAACEAANDGVPAMRAMVLEFPEDPACETLDRQYMLGENLLVAPVFSEDKTVRYYVPEGTWTHFLSGIKVQGGRWYSETYDYFSLPLLARPNSLIAVGNCEDKAEYNFSENVMLHMFELEDGKNAQCIVYSPGGEKALEVVVKRSGVQLQVKTIAGDKPWKLLLHGIEAVSSATGSTCEAGPNGILVTPENKSSFSIML
ncbi:MAG: alpha-xylosidase [Thermoclostridium sp.]|nr:alpha-xylosidase [Thermoclostridium sp.]